MSNPGFNLIGYATSPMGLGEDLRAFACMLDHLKLPYSVIDLPTESRGKVKHDWQMLTQEDYKTSFFFMSPMECMRLSQAQPTLFNSQIFKVGYFLWELPDYPKEYVAALDLVDQIWCPTKFVQHTLFRDAQKLTLTIPLPVIVAPAATRNFRAELGIPDDAFVALYLFDVRSTLARKNPHAIIDAFRQFSQKNKNCYLILKMSRWQEVDKSLLNWIPQDPSIRLVTENLTPAELSSLYQSANIYLSLHKSEGFGRTLVEALQHGLKVISTSFSGPADYLDDTVAYLVDWQKQDVDPGDYPFTDGSYWANPSIPSAIQALGKAKRQNRKKRSQEAKDRGLQYSVDSMAERYELILRTYLKS